MEAAEGHPVHQRGGMKLLHKQVELVQSGPKDPLQGPPVRALVLHVGRPAAPHFQQGEEVKSHLGANNAGGHQSHGSHRAAHHCPLS